MHVEGERVEAADALAAHARTFPAAKCLDARPRARGCAGSTVDVDRARLDPVQEAQRFLRVLAEEARGQAVLRVVGKAQPLVNARDLGDV